MYVYPELKDDDKIKMEIEYHYKNPDIDFDIIDDVYVFDLDIKCRIGWEETMEKAIQHHEFYRQGYSDGYIEGLNKAL